MSLITRPRTPGLKADGAFSGIVLTADGIYTEAQLKAVLGDQLNGLFQLGQVDGGRERGCSLFPLISGAENDTVSLRIHRVDPVRGRGKQTLRAYQTELLYTIALTASTLVYAIGTIDDAIAYRAVDTIGAPTKTDRATHYETETGAAISVHSPADNTQGLISMTDLAGAWGVIFEPVVVSGTQKFNVLVEPRT